MHGVTPHIVGERHQFKIFESAVRAIAILEDNDMARWNRTFVMLPHVTIQQRPDFHVAESVGLALDSFAHFDPQKTFRVRADCADWTPVPRGDSGASALLEPCRRHAPGRPPGHALPFVR